MDGSLNSWTWSDAISPWDVVHPLWLWIAGTVLLYALASNALWLVRRRGMSHGRRLSALASQMGVVPREQPRTKWLTRSRYFRWLVQGGRFLFYLAIPYLALGGWPRQPYQGLLALEDLGIVGVGGRWPVTRWLEAVGTGLGWGLLALLLLTLALVNARGYTAEANRRAGGVRLRFPPQPWWVIVVDVLYLEVHWAFLRGGLAVALDDKLGGHALYAAAFLGLGLVYLEWSLNPFWREGWRPESQAAVRWVRAALALVVAVLYLFTRNLWVCLAVHWLLEFPVRWLGRERVLDVVVSR
jgi:hypothetical protein